MEATKRTQRRLAIVLVALAALSAGLAAWSKPAGAFAFIGVAARGARAATAERHVKLP